MKYFNKIAFGINMLPLAIALRRQPELWGRYPNRCVGDSPHRETEDIWIRYADIRKTIDAVGPIAGESESNKEHHPVWWPAYRLLPQIRPILFGLMSLVEGEELGTVILIRVPAGKQIYPHVDDGWSANYYAKYFIAVENQPGATFNFPDGERIAAEPGDVHWFTNRVPHNVTNPTATDQILLIATIRSDRNE